MFPPDTRILIAEDSGLARKQIGGLLISMGYTHLSEAENGLQAIAKLVEGRSSRSPFGLIISDWEMPDLTGLEFLRMIRTVTQWVSIPVIFITSFNKTEDVVAAITAGVDYYLVKPTTRDALEKKIKDAYQKTIGKSRYETGGPSQPKKASSR